MRIVISASLMVFILALSANPITALMRVVPFENVVGNASDVVEGTVMTQTSFWSEDGFTIYTDVLVRVDTSLKGTHAKGDFVVVRSEGGVVGETGIRVEHQPLFTLQERVMLFLTDGVPSQPRTILHLEQGKFTIVPEGIVDFKGAIREPKVFRSEVRMIIDDIPGSREPRR